MLDGYQRRWRKEPASRGYANHVLPLLLLFVGEVPRDACRRVGQCRRVNASRLDVRRCQGQSNNRQPPTPQNPPPPPAGNAILQEGAHKQPGLAAAVFCSTTFLPGLVIVGQKIACVRHPTALGALSGLAIARPTTPIDVTPRSAAILAL